MGQQPARTVIVVGAGASHEFGLPVGSVLQDQISHQTRLSFEHSKIQSLSHNSMFLDLLPKAVGLNKYTINDVTRLGHKSIQISEGVKYAASIDNYLHAHRDDHELVAIGKLAIAHCILEAESLSSLAYKVNGIQFSAGSNTIAPNHSWVGLLVKLLSAGRNFSEFCEAVSSIDFVCFNYDRCIERYIFSAASLIYPVADFSVEKLTDALKIVHPYGSLGDLRPEQGAFGTFGRHNDGQFLFTSAQTIRTFTEGMESEARFKIRDAFASASNVVFLGYGFITVNDKFLFDEAPFEIGTVLGTTFGISDERTEFIAGKLRETCLMQKHPHHGWRQRGEPELRSEGCADLIQRFSHLFERIGNTDA